MIIAVLAIGSWPDKEYIYQYLENIHKLTPIDCVIGLDYGDADIAAGEWTVIHGGDIERVVLPVNLSSYTYLGRWKNIARKEVERVVKRIDRLSPRWIYIFRESSVTPEPYKLQDLLSGAGYNFRLRIIDYPARPPL